MITVCDHARDHAVITRLFLLGVGEEQVRRQHVFNVMPGRQGDRIPFMYCEDHSFERELNEWIP